MNREKGDRRCVLCKKKLINEKLLCLRCQLRIRGPMVSLGAATISVIVGHEINQAGQSSDNIDSAFADKEHAFDSENTFPTDEFEEQDDDQL